MKARTITAVFVDFVGQIFALCHSKPHSCEELWDSGEETNTAHSMFFRLDQQSFH
jgi:hypothetical protein